MGGLRQLRVVRALGRAARARRRCWFYHFALVFILYCVLVAYTLWLFIGALREESFNIGLSPYGCGG